MADDVKRRIDDLSSTRFTTIIRRPGARFVRQQWTDAGMLRVTVQLPADEGARLLAAIESVVDEIIAGIGRTGNHRHANLVVVRSIGI